MAKEKAYMMNPRFETRGAFRVLGVEADAHQLDDQDPGFHDLWMNRFMARHDAVAAQSTDKAYYGLFLTRFHLVLVVGDLTEKGFAAIL
jgi:hypothetical protein